MAKVIGWSGEVLRGLEMGWSVGLLGLLLIILLLLYILWVVLTTSMVQYTVTGNAMYLAACYVLWMVTC